MLVIRFHPAALQAVAVKVGLVLGNSEKLCRFNVHEVIDRVIPVHLRNRRVCHEGLIVTVDENTHGRLLKESPELCFAFTDRVFGFFCL